MDYILYGVVSGLVVGAVVIAFKLRQWAREAENIPTCNCCETPSADVYTINKTTTYSLSSDKPKVKKNARTVRSKTTRKPKPRTRKSS